VAVDVLVVDRCVAAADTTNLSSEVVFAGAMIVLILFSKIVGSPSIEPTSNCCFESSELIPFTSTARRAPIVRLIKSESVVVLVTFKFVVVDGLLRHRRVPLTDVLRLLSLWPLCFGCRLTETLHAA